MFKVSFWGGKIVSDEGFTVFLRHTSVKYQEGTMHVSIASETDGKVIDLFHSSMKYLVVDDKTGLIDNASEKRIVDNIFRALEARGLYVRLVT